MTHLNISETISVVQAVSALVVAFAAAVGAFKWAPQFLNRVRLLADLNMTRSELSDTQRLNMTLNTSLHSINESMTAQSHALDELRKEVGEMRRVQIISARYIKDLIVHIRDRGGPDTMPPIPDELRDDVLEHLRTDPTHDAMTQLG